MVHECTTHQNLFSSKAPLITGDIHNGKGPSGPIGGSKTKLIRGVFQTLQRPLVQIGQGDVAFDKAKEVEFHLKVSDHHGVRLGDVPLLTSQELDEIANLTDVGLRPVEGPCQGVRLSHGVLVQHLVEFHQMLLQLGQTGDLFQSLILRGEFGVARQIGPHLFSLRFGQRAEFSGGAALWRIVPNGTRVFVQIFFVHGGVLRLRLLLRRRHVVHGQGHYLVCFCFGLGVDCSCCCWVLEIATEVQQVKQKIGM
mmetsp:Transcript_15177/g.24567  ORF Transcript_15177/g.24567 Transcript_15177/m.24567 type:complete len:253 (-) Transcript_15177:49-807(-)